MNGVKTSSPKIDTVNSLPSTNASTKIDESNFEAWIIEFSRLPLPGLTIDMPKLEPSFAGLTTKVLSRAVISPSPDK